MAVFLRRERRGDLPLPVIPPFPGTNIYGQSVVTTPDAALQVPAVWACVKLLADIVSMLPLRSYQQRGEDKQSVPVPALIAAPSADATMADWLYMLMVSLLLRGNAYALVAAVDVLGRPTQLELQHPDSVAVRVDQNGHVTYRIKGKAVAAYSDGGGVGSVWHMRAFRMPGSPLGLSPIAYAARTLGIELESSKFALDFFRAGAHPSAVLQSDSPVTQEQARTIKDRFLNAVKNREPAVLGAGVKYQQIQVSPEESQFLATQKFNATQIARFFGVPAEMIGADSGNSMTYSNVEQRSLDLLTYGVQPWLQRIESAVFPLLTRPTFVRFDTAELLRTDMLTQYKSLAIGIAGKFLHFDEARKVIDRAPLTQQQKDDMALVPLTVSPTGLPKSAPPVGPGADEPAVAEAAAAA